MLQTTVVTATGLAQMSAGYTAGKYVAEFRSTEPERAGRIMGLCYATSAFSGVIAGVLLFALAPLLAGSALNAPHLTTELRALALFVPFSVAAASLTGALAGLESFAATASVAVAFGLSYFCLCGLGALWLGLGGSVSGLVVAAICQWCAAHRMLGRECRKRGLNVSLRGAAREFRVLWGFALPSTLSSFSSLPSVWFASMCLAKQTQGFAQLALFTAASSLRGLVVFLPNNLNTVVLSILNNQLGLKRQSGYKQVFLLGLAVNATLVVGGVACLSLVGPVVLQVFGKSFVEGKWVLVVVLATAIPEVIGTCAAQVVQSRGKLWHSLFLVALPKDLTIATLAYVLTVPYGPVGLAVAHLCGWTVALVGVTYLAVRWWPKDESHEDSAKPCP